MQLPAESKYTDTRVSEFMDAITASMGAADVEQDLVVPAASVALHHPHSLVLLEPSVQERTWVLSEELRALPIEPEKLVELTDTGSVPLCPAEASVDKKSAAARNVPLRIVKADLFKCMSSFLSLNECARVRSRAFSYRKSRDCRPVACSSTSSPSLGAVERPMSSRGHQQKYVPDVRLVDLLLEIRERRGLTEDDFRVVSEITSVAFRRPSFSTIAQNRLTNVNSFGSLELVQ